MEPARADRQHGELQLGHETTPELGQLAGVALFLAAMNAGTFRSGSPGRGKAFSTLPA